MERSPGRAWSAPKLTVLTRGRAEESVLGACKMSATGTGPEGGNDQCLGAGAELCSECYAFMTS